MRLAPPKIRPHIWLMTIFNSPEMVATRKEKKLITK